MLLCRVKKKFRVRGEWIKSEIIYPATDLGGILQDMPDGDVGKEKN